MYNHYICTYPSCWLSNITCFLLVCGRWYRFYFKAAITTWPDLCYSICNLLNHLNFSLQCTFSTVLVLDYAEFSFLSERFFLILFRIWRMKVLSLVTSQLFIFLFIALNIIEALLVLVMMKIVWLQNFLLFVLKFFKTL